LGEVPSTRAVPLRAARHRAGCGTSEQRAQPILGERLRQGDGQRMSVTALGSMEAERIGVGARLDYHALNAQLNLFAADGSIQFDKDREAAREYFRQHVIPGTVRFDSLEEKIDYLIENDYYEEAFIRAYDWS